MSSFFMMVSLNQLFPDFGSDEIEKEHHIEQPLHQTRSLMKGEKDPQVIDGEQQHRGQRESPCPAQQAHEAAAGGDEHHREDKKQWRVMAAGDHAEDDDYGEQKHVEADGNQPGKLQNAAGG